jgi:predicted nucleotidyltransferase
MSRKEINRIILECLKRYDPQIVGLFGSYARNEQTKRSDIDILVHFRTSISLLKLIQLENELSDRLGIKVDLITEGAIKNSRVHESIENDLQIIYQA